MRDELDEKLVKEFPNLYRNRNGGMRTTCMYWGFEHGDGWFDIIYELSAKLEKLILEIPKEDREWTCASQVKEKYGTLRFYMTMETDEMSTFISEAERKSEITCETCGKPGEIRGRGWLMCICDECYKDNK